MLSIVIFILGSVFGSFANVVVFRYGKQSVVFPRSTCPHCHNPIFWYDNIPIVSWMLLCGKCRNCRTTISPQYPLLEIYGGLVALIVIDRLAISPLSIIIFGVLLLLAIVALIDFRHYVIALAPTLMIVLLSLGASWYQNGRWHQNYIGASRWLGFMVWFTPKIVGALGGLIVMSAILILSTYLARAADRIDRDQLAMGWGDPILASALGALLGWRALPWVVALGCAQGVVYFFVNEKIFAIEEGLHPPDHAIPQHSLPLGTFLCVGAIEIVLFWPSITLF